MTAREAIIALWIKYRQDWDAIYHAVLSKETDDLEKYLEDVDVNDFVTIFDEDYPQRLRERSKPPFVL